MQVARADPDQPDLCIGNASVQLVAGLQLFIINLIRAALDVDGGVLISNGIPYEEYFARAR